MKPQKPNVKLPLDYANLAAIFMPRPLHDEVDYHNALKILDSMAGFKLNPDQEDYFDALMWSVIGAHPPGLSDGYYGHWRYPPDVGA